MISKMSEELDKKIGIVADNYKVGKFEKILSKKGFVFEKHAFTPTSTVIQVKTSASRLSQDINRVEVICRAVEDHFKRRN